MRKSYIYVTDFETTNHEGIIVSSVKVEIEYVILPGCAEVTVPNDKAQPGESAWADVVDVRERAGYTSRFKTVRSDALYEHVVDWSEGHQEELLRHARQLDAAIAEWAA